MTAKTVVVLTQDDDVTADLVVLELGRRDVPVFRFDTAEFPGALAFTGELDGGRYTGGLRSAHHHVDLADIGAVYYRKPTSFRFPAGMSDAAVAWADTEATMGLGGVLSTLGVTWVSHPHATSRAEYKPLQLIEAHRCRLRTPRTIVTNDPARARQFAESCPAGTVYKVLCVPPRDPDGVRRDLFTTPVTVEQAGDPSVAGTAHLFQEQIDKAYEVRLVVVGREVFAARIDAGSDAARVDWRSDADALTYSVIDPPPHVRVASVALTARLGLNFGAFDFAVTPAGKWVFFEVNPNGQWGWIPDIREPITHALADLLTQRADQHDR